MKWATGYQSRRIRPVALRPCLLACLPFVFILFDNTVLKHDCQALKAKKNGKTSLEISTFSGLLSGSQDGFPYFPNLCFIVYWFTFFPL
jgi:hypothetical protein